MKAEDRKTSSSQELKEELRAQGLLAEELRGKTEELAAANSDLVEFASIVSHDLREPLIAIGGFLRLLKRRHAGDLGPEGEKILEKALQNAERMQEMLEGLLSLCRLREEQGQVETVDMDGILDSAVENLDDRIRKSEARVSYDPLPRVRGKRSQLIQLFQNLISNAVKYQASEPPVIHVSGEKSGDEWVFAVRDNGKGIRPEDQDRVFGVFERAGERKSRGSAGLGLSICEKIVKRHGGQIWCESEPGQGSVFYFTIPLSGRSS